MRTKRIFPGFSTIGEEFAKGMATNVTGNFVATVKDSEYPQEKMGDELKVLPWNVTDCKTNNRFHVIFFPE
jgi:hypothetical protein